MLSRSKGFTLLEAMLVVAILGVMSVGLGSILKSSWETWASTTGRMKLTQESRLAIISITKLVQNSQSSSLKITRLNSNQPANSYIAGKIMETVYINAATAGGCGFSATGSEVVGSSGEDYAIYQDGRYLIGKYPVPPSNPDFSNPSTITFTYRYVTLSASVDQFMVAFDEAASEKSISAALRLSTRISSGKVTRLMLKQRVIVKHQYTSGYYGN
jgi:prepilin-type N-terminal cleavage/methylation domain-containing protein